jgi:GAF domain-containing protein
MSPLSPGTQTSLEALARDVAACAGVKVAAVWVADEAARTLAVAAAAGDDAGSLPLVTLAYSLGGVGWVAANRQALEVADVFTDPRFVGLDWRQIHGLSSFFGLPLVIQDRLHGVLALDGPAPITLTAAQRDQLADLATRAATLLDDAHRQEEARRQEAALAASHAEVAARVREMSALITVAGVLGTTTDLPEGLRLICREVARLTAADTAAAYLLDRQRNEAFPVAGYRIPEEVRKGLAGARMPLGDTRFADTLFAERRVVWSDDAPHDPRFANSFFLRFPHRSCVLIPLVAKTNVSGVVHLVWWTQARPLSVSEAALLQAIGQQAGVLLDNARLFEAERRAEALRAATSLANAAAHEINNPLSIIVGNLQMLERASGPDPSRRIARALDAAARIEEIVRRMSHITRLENVEDRGHLPPMLDLRRSSDAPPPSDAP